MRLPRPRIATFRRAIYLVKIFPYYYWLIYRLAVYLYLAPLRAGFRPFHCYLVFAENYLHTVEVGVTVYLRYKTVHSYNRHYPALLARESVYFIGEGVKVVFVCYYEECRYFLIGRYSAIFARPHHCCLDGVEEVYRIEIIFDSHNLE